MKKNLVFLISEKCNHDCLYCIRKENDKKELFSGKFLNLKKESIIKHLKLYKKYINEISLTGGEPLLNPEIIFIMEQAIDGGVTKITLHTNGALLSDDKFLNFLPAHKDFLKLVVSLPSTNEAVYRQITKTNNFSKVINNIKLYLDLGLEIYINIVVSRLNFADLKQTVQEVIELGIKNIQFLGIDTYNPDYNIRYSETLPVLNEIVGQHWPAINFKMYALPKCLIKQYPNLAQAWQVKTNQATYNEFTIGSQALLLKTDYLKFSRSKAEVCQRCALKQECAGIFKSYLQVFGDKEFNEFVIV